jgi:LPXTG-motif cell wall-anchored protein
MTHVRLVVATLLVGALLAATTSAARAADPYPVATPTPTPSAAPEANGIGPDEDEFSKDGPGRAPDEADQADDDGILPGTGGASIYVLLAAGVLLVVGGSIVHSSRRRAAS